MTAMIHLQTLHSKLITVIQETALPHPSSFVKGSRDWGQLKKMLKITTALILQLLSRLKMRCASRSEALLQTILLLRDFQYVIPILDSK
eukprot:661707-Rhodomonas_salina.2